MEATKLAWAAGFIDGEGYIGIIRQKWNNGKTDRWHYRPAIDVAQSCPEPIMLLQDLFNVGRVVRQRVLNGTYCWHWVLTGPVEIHDVLTQLYPFFVVKKRQAELVMQFRKTVVPRGTVGRFAHLPASVIKEREDLFNSVKALNTRTVQAERLNKEAPTPNGEGGAIVRSHGKDNHESEAEMTSPTTVQ